jgi:phosphohistidine phosphatase
MLFLVQHGEAMTEQEHPERPLTPRGRAEVERVAVFLAGCGLPRPSEIRHSGKRRAEETAQIFARVLSLGHGVRVMKGLAPNDDAASLARELEDEEPPLLLVGHLPLLARLATFLVAGREEPTVVRFRTGGLVALEREGARWVVAALVTPDMLLPSA